MCPFKVFGRRCRIRTCGFMLPKHARWPDYANLRIVCGRNSGARTHDLRIKSPSLTSNWAMFRFLVAWLRIERILRLMRPLCCHYTHPHLLFYFWCHLSDSNRRPIAYKAIAPPTELKWHVFWLRPEGSNLTKLCLTGRPMHHARVGRNNHLLGVQWRARTADIPLVRRALYQLS